MQGVVIGPLGFPITRADFPAPARTKDGTEPKIRSAGVKLWKAKPETRGNLTSALQLNEKLARRLLGQ